MLVNNAGVAHYMPLAALELGKVVCAPGVEDGRFLPCHYPERNEIIIQCDA